VPPGQAAGTRGVPSVDAQMCRFGLTLFAALPLALLATCCAPWVDAADPDQDGIEFFEKKIRPVLVERCYECHSSQAKQLEGGLSLETRQGMLAGGDRGPAITPGDAEKSLLIRAVRYNDSELQMPPKERLSAETIADFEAWVNRGAPDPRTGPAAGKYAVDIEAARKQWPFTPPLAAPLPAVKNATWPRNEIDYFILARLEEKGLAPAVDADKRTLIRRVTYDLVGLPPSPEEIAAFLSDESPQAFERLVDRLLQSPHYGERWGRHWLDVVRYADTAGDNSDYPIPQMYRYRNWVIQALNADMPYDEFIRQQIAGDLLPASSSEERYQKIIATGYIASARRFGSRVDDYPQHLTIEDTIDNLGKAFLGLSINCARCHNHKFDPITTEDYYALYGIFHSTRYPWPGIELDKRQRDLVPLVPEEAVEAALAERRTKLAELDKALKEVEAAKKAAEEQAKSAEDKEAAKKRIAALDEKVKAARKAKTDYENSSLPFEQAYAVAEGKKIEDVPVQIKGDPMRPGAMVERRMPAVFGGMPIRLIPQGVAGGEAAAGQGGTEVSQAPGAGEGQGLSAFDAKSTSGRLALAHWIASCDNPLTARVMINRLWHYHFGRGIVATPNDFGRQGKPPTHPELLDWLAVRFMESGWSLKAMHRLILTSRTWQLGSAEVPSPKSQVPSQPSGVGQEGAVVESPTSESNPLPRNTPQSVIRNLQSRDPDNSLFGRASRRRLDAESIRDTLLVLGGNLDPTMGGPHPFPPQETWDFTQHKPFKEVFDTNRRSVYLMTQRIQRHPLMAIFDGPDTSASTGSRITSTTTLQALYFLNDPFVHAQAGRIAERLRVQRKTDAERIALAYEMLYGRAPEGDEVPLCQKHLDTVRDKLKSAGKSDDEASAGAWDSLVRVLLRANEFVYVN
jgi:hypothetical protein